MLALVVPVGVNVEKAVLSVPLSETVSHGGKVAVAYALTETTIGGSKMGNQIAVTYKWTAKPGKMDELKAIYGSVAQQTEANEPGVPWMDYYEVQGADALIIQEEFEDGAALAVHLGGTAAQHFPQLSEIADMGPFFVFGDVPDELVQTVSGMGATLASRVSGFSRS